MGDRYLTDLADVCRRTGYPVIEVGSGPGQTGPAWKQRARGSGGYGNGLPNHLVIHHTASGPASDGWADTNYCTFGDNDAPLCNLYLSRDGTIYVCAAGGTNTNGTGQDSCGLIADDTMNSSAIGIEAANDGVGEPWPEVQQAAYVELCVGLTEAYDIGVAQIHAHAEWAPARKIDPAGPSAWAAGSATWEMDDFRFDVALDPDKPEPEPIPTEADPMPFIIRNRQTGEIALVYGDHQVVGLAGGDLDAYEARFGPALPTDPVVWFGFINKA